MAGGIRSRKSKRKVNPANYVKKRKNKTKLPPKVMKDVKEKWDHKKSLKQNLQSLNLVYSPDEMLHGTATEPVAMEEELIPKATHKIPKSTPDDKSPHITPNKAQFISAMISDHQDNYEKMARDKRNIYQLSAGQLRKQCLQFIGSKQFLQTKE
ncbi:nucleolar protein 16-like [Dysidea avara]|uniref:nucleolar protein 16-like n=1 Tax=Dysidea avara TaxID=196820 RepID=UPI00331962F0